ncbi:unnamed protein product [Dibothriocephalus latus]|uniref:Helix-turn-helix domain-containing protein n=1 Tax=Dibothriocephalus latus TaxID=60516 RepID=A0A3P6UB09_DIBLA|nr:unnamed protein product [Dibothriocephalus latus]
MNVGGSKMLSLDVFSTFTNLPVVETINYLYDVIQDNNYQIVMPMNTRKELLTQCTPNVQLLCNSQFYTHIDGVAMRSSFGQFLANVLIGKIEKISLSDTINDLTFFGRYVDDISFRDLNADTDALVAKFNSINPSLKFSAETEVDDETAFLDVLLKWEDDGSIRRRVFQKKTWTGQYTNLHSYVPLNIKRNLVQELAARVRQICCPASAETELPQLQHTSIGNGNPERLILKNIDQRSKRLPFLGIATSNLVRRRLRIAITSALAAANLGCSSRTFPSYDWGSKDRFSLKATSVCIYCFTCFRGAGYIGRTKRRLEKSVVYRTPANMFKGLRQRMLVTAKAMAILLATPVLYCQKTLTKPLPFRGRHRLLVAIAFCTHLLVAVAHRTRRTRRSRLLAQTVIVRSGHSAPKSDSY